MADKVVKLDPNAKGFPTMPEQPERFPPWSVTVIIALLSMLASAAASTLVVGVYVGRYTDRLENTVTMQNKDREEFHEQIRTLAAGVNALNSTVAGLNAGVEGLRSSMEHERQDLDRERQDRLNNDIRQRNGR